MWSNVSDLKDEYQKYNCPLIVSNLENAKGLLICNKDEFHDFTSECLKEVLVSNLEYLKARVLAFFMASDINPLAFKADKEILGEEANYGMLFQSCQERLIDILNLKNYEEVSRLSEFCRSQFFVLDKMMEIRRDAIFYNIDSGFYNQYSPTMISDITSSLAVFQEFFDEEVHSLKKPFKVNVKSGKR